VLRQLEILDVSNNKITALGNVFEATSLRVLLLENNALESLPLELCYLTNLQTLSLHGNPQRTVRQAILQKGASAILTVSAMTRLLLLTSDLLPLSLSCSLSTEPAKQT
jgi:Leucine-rich repeat (LRR) protein